MGILLATVHIFSAVTGGTGAPVAILDTDIGDDIDDT